MAIREVRDKFVESCRVSKLVSDKAPFFLKGTPDLTGLDLKNMRYLWKEAVAFNYKDMRQQRSTIQRLAGTDSNTLGAHSEAVVNGHYYTAREAWATAEMEKVFAYMAAGGLEANPGESPIPTEEAKELMDRNRREAEEFMRLEKEGGSERNSHKDDTKLRKE